MKKVRRFNGEDDSYVEGTASSLADDANDQFRQDQTERMARLARGENANAPETPAASTSRSMASEKTAAAEPKAKPAIVTLKQLDAFKAKYGADKDLTDYMNAQQGLKRKNAPPPITPSESDSGRGPTVEKAQALKEAQASKEAEFKKAEEEAQSAAGKAKRAAMEKSQALENVYPEQALLGGAGFGIKSIAGLAKNLANRGGVKEVAKRVEPTFREVETIKEVPRLLTGPEKQLALPKPTPRLGFDKAGAKAAERSGRAEGRQAEMLKENARRSGLQNFTMMKRGGAVKGYASGGSVSASSRGDGIAQRGKTRGKMC